MSKTNTRRSSKSALSAPVAPRGPKAGQARANQSVKIADAKPPKGKAPTLTEKMSKLATDYEKAHPGAQARGRAPFKETTARKLVIEPRPARLARGLDSHNAPQSARAAAESQRALNKGKERTVKAPKAKAPSRGGNRSYVRGKKANTARPGTFRHYFLETLFAHKDEESAKAAHAKSKQYADTKFNFNWAAAQGYIVWK